MLFQLRGCSKVGKAVTSDTRGLRLKSSHYQNFIMNIFTVNCWKDKNKEKRGGNGLLKNIVFSDRFPSKILYDIDHDSSRFNFRRNIITFEGWCWRLRHLWCKIHVLKESFHCLPTKPKQILSECLLTSASERLFDKQQVCLLAWD